MTREDIAKMTNEELEAVRGWAYAELDKRRIARKQKLIENLKKAWREIEDEGVYIYYDDSLIDFNDFEFH